MKFDEALNQMKAIIAKATGSAVKMTPADLLTYVAEQVKAAESDTEQVKKERLAALTAVFAKAETASAAGATEFEIEAFKAAAPTAPASDLDKLVADLVVTVNTMKSKVDTLVVDAAAALAKAVPAPAAETPVPAVVTPVADPIPDPVAVAKSEEEEDEEADATWGGDLNSKRHLK